MERKCFDTVPVIALHTSPLPLPRSDSFESNYWRWWMMHAMKSFSVTIRIKATELYSSVVPFLFLNFWRVKLFSRVFFHLIFWTLSLYVTWPGSHLSEFQHIITSFHTRAEKEHTKGAKQTTANQCQFRHCTRHTGWNHEPLQVLTFRFFLDMYLVCFW